MAAPSSALARLLETLSSDRAARRSRTRDAYLELLAGASAAERAMAETVIELAMGSGEEPGASATDGDATLVVSARDAASRDAPLSATAPESEVGAAASSLVVGGYQVLRELGRGGMGIVYLARDPVLKRHVALKLLPHHFAASATARVRFRREAEIASRLDHPNLCAVLAMGSHEGIAWLAMRYVAGETLADVLRRGGEPYRGDWRVAVELIETVARAVHVAHESGVVHRDLKPGNVMITEDGTPVVLDFGLAQDMTEEGAGPTQTGDVLGTPYYMAPEQIRGETHRADHRLDVWALGVMLCELVAGERPFDAPSRDALYRRILEHEPRSLRSAHRKVPRDLEVVAATALAKDPRHRYETARDLADDLRAVLDIQPIRARPPGMLARAVKFARRRPAMTLLLLVVLLGGPAVSVLLTRQVLTRKRVEATIERSLNDARAALDRRDPRRARRLVGDVRALDPGAAPLAAIVARCDALEALERVETLALDDEADPEGRLTLTEIASLRGRGLDAARLAVLEVYVLLRAGRTGEAEEAARRYASEGGGSLGELLVDGVSSPEAVGAPDQDPETVLACALLHSARSRHRAALTLLEQLLERVPGAHGLAWAAAEESTRMQAYDAALGFAGRARAATEGFGPRRAARYGVHLRRAGLLQEALAEGRRALAGAPADPVVWLHLANTLAAVGERGAAAALFAEILQDAPALSQAWRGQGALLYDLERWEEAAAAFEKALGLRPDDPDTLLDLGNVLIEMDRPEEAERRLREAMALRGDFPYASNSLATALRNQGRLDAARAAAEEALKLRPGYADALGSLASILHRQGHLEEAEQRYREALGLDPAHLKSLFNLALLLHDRRPAEAITIYEKVIAADPEDAAALTNLAHLLASEGRAEEAIPLARRACEIAPDDVVNWNNLATAQVDAGRVEEAITTLRRAVAADARRIEPHANLMLLLETADPLAALAHAILLTVHDDSYATNAQSNLIQLRAAVAASGADHPLAAAAALQEAGSDDEDAFLEIFASLRALPEGAPGSRDRCLRQATCAVLARIARKLGRRDDAAALRRAAQGDSPKE